MATKEEREAIANRMLRVLMLSGAVPDDKGWYDWCLASDHGPYRVKIDVTQSMATLFGRYDTPNQETGNPYSGKHNMHLSGGIEPDAVERGLVYHLTQAGVDVPVSEMVSLQ